jgi:hypothetical protein
MSDEEKSARELIEELQRSVEQMERDRRTRTTRFKVNKRTHLVRFEGETEDSVEVVIEPRNTEGEAP